MKPLKDKISITIDSDLLEKLRELADADCRPLSQYINLVLKKHVDELESKLYTLIRPLRFAAVFSYVSW